MGYKIKEIREARNMTQEELAERSGVSRTTISSLENQSSKITSTKTLLKIAEALETPVEKIFFTATV